MATDGNRLIQITVSVDDTVPKTKVPLKTNFIDQNKSTSKDDFFSNYLESAVSGKDDLESSNVGNEISILREELNRLNTSLRRMVSSEFTGDFAKVYEKLLNIGVAGQDVESLIKHAYIRLDGIKNVDSSIILDSIKSEMISPLGKAGYADTPEQKIIVLIGPTGVGKSTSIMKLASHSNIFSGKSVGIISTDTYRIAAGEPLKVFSKIASIPVLESRNREELIKCIHDFSDKDIILIDTPGRSPFFPNYVQELQDYVSLGIKMDILLTLSVTNDLEDIALSAGLYSILKPRGVILTKIDETARPGKIYSILKQLSLPAIFLSDGQGIPKDIYPAEGVNFWKIMTEAMS